jgi:hypothetical protein
MHREVGLILNFVLKEYGVMVWTGLILLQIGTYDELFEQGN